jgi:hypothetical protein
MNIYKLIINILTFSFVIFSFLLCFLVDLVLNKILFNLNIIKNPLIIMEHKILLFISFIISAIIFRFLFEKIKRIIQNKIN